MTGARKTLVFGPEQAVCPYCRGYGVEASTATTEYRLCAYCAGTGSVSEPLAAANERIRELEAANKLVSSRMGWEADRAANLDVALVDEREVSAQAQADVKHFRDALAAEQRISGKLEAALKYIETYLGSAIDDEEKTGRLTGSRMLLGDAQKVLAEVAAIRAGGK